MYHLLVVCVILWLNTSNVVGPLQAAATMRQLSITLCQRYIDITTCQKYSVKKLQDIAEPALTVEFASSFCKAMPCFDVCIMNAFQKSTFKITCVNIYTIRKTMLTCLKHCDLY